MLQEYQKHCKILHLKILLVNITMKGISNFYQAVISYVLFYHMRISYGNLVTQCFDLNELEEYLICLYLFLLLKISQSKKSVM